MDDLSPLLSGAADLSAEGYGLYVAGFLTAVVLVALLARLVRDGIRGDDGRDLYRLKRLADFQSGVLVGDAAGSITYALVGVSLGRLC